MKVLKDKAGNQYIKIKETLCKLFYNPIQNAFSTWYGNLLLWINKEGKIIKKFDITKLIPEYKFDNCKSSTLYFKNKRSCTLCPSIAICQCSLNTQRYTPVKKDQQK